MVGADRDYVYKVYIIHTENATLLALVFDLFSIMITPDKIIAIAITERLKLSTWLFLQYLSTWNLQLVPLSQAHHQMNKVE